MTDYPIRQKPVLGAPKAAPGWRACATCGADHWSLVPGVTGERGIWREWRWYCSQECDPTKTDGPERSWRRGRPMSTWGVRRAETTTQGVSTVATTHQEAEPKPVDVRWQCPRGHFIAHDAIEMTDYPNLLGSYYGIRTEWFYHCRACGCDYIDDHGPRIAVQEAINRRVE